MIISAIVQHRAGKLAVWAGETAAGGSDLSVPLLLLVGVVGFTFGGLIGADMTMRMFRRRDEVQARERRVLNEEWRLLREEQNIQREPWTASDRDRTSLDPQVASRDGRRRLW